MSLYRVPENAHKTEVLLARDWDPNLRRCHLELGFTMPTIVGFLCAGKAKSATCQVRAASQALDSDSACYCSYHWHGHHYCISPSLTGTAVMVSNLVITAVNTTPIIYKYIIACCHRCFSISAASWAGTRTLPKTTTCFSFQRKDPGPQTRN